MMEIIEKFDDQRDRYFNKLCSPLSPFNHPPEGEGGREAENVFISVELYKCFKNKIKTWRRHSI